MSNKIQNTPIKFRCHSSKSLIQNYFHADKQCIIQPDGTLWCIAAMNHAYMQLMRSTTNGFSWDVISANFSQSTDLRISDALQSEGPLCNMLFHDLWNYIDLIYANYDIDYNVWRLRINADELFSNKIVGEDYNYFQMTGTVVSDNYQGFYKVDNSRRNGWIFYPTESNTMKLKITSNTSSSEASYTFSDNALYPFCAMKGTKDNDVHCIYTTEQSSSNYLRYKKFTDLTGTFGSSVTIKNAGDNTTYFVNINIESDGYNTLIVVYDQITDTGINTYYSLSTNGGTSWSSPTEIELTSGHTDFSERLEESEWCSNPDVIGGVNGGFFICYTRVNADSYARVYVRPLTTTNGTTYTLGDEVEIATTNYPDQHITGGKFFKPICTDMLDISNPGLIRIAYSVGLGKSVGGSYDPNPVTLAQELLNESAYPETLDTDGTFIDDSGDTSHFVVNFNNLGGPIYNVDYYEQGLTGNYTNIYEKALNKVGVYLRFLKYEPIKESLMSDKSSYGQAEEYIQKILIDPETYSFPTPQIAAADITAWLEQDVRKVYLPPDFFISRTFLVNAGGFLKRTVWLVEYNGNQYEISQVVPRFLDTQLCFYEANVYVVGPSRDPFSRVVLPSET